MIELRSMGLKGTFLISLFQINTNHLEHAYKHFNSLPDEFNFVCRHT